MATQDKNVDPALWPLAESFPAIDLGPETLPAFRAALAAMAAIPEASSHADVSIDELTVPGGGRAAETVRCLLFRPTRRPSPAALLHIHGGGYVMGTPEMDIARNIELVRATGCTILSVEYRLAPEHPHPAGLEDCQAALVWLAAQTEKLRVQTERIGVIGESAGGGLAAGLALSVRDRLPLACQVLIYPMLVPPSGSVDTPEPDPRIGQYIWTRASNNYCWSALLSDTPPADQATVAGLAPDVVGLPPTFLAVGELDLFVHDNLAYVRKLLVAGCSVEAHLYPGAFHGFDRMVEAPVSMRYTRDLVDFMLRHLG
jgi:acetyl esterase/lipase